MPQSYRNLSSLKSLLTENGCSAGRQAHSLLFLYCVWIVFVYLWVCLCVLRTCNWVCVCHGVLQSWGSLPLFKVPGIKLRSSGLCGKCLYPRGHLAGPSTLFHLSFETVCLAQASLKLTSLQICLKNALTGSLYLSIYIYLCIYLSIIYIYTYIYICLYIYASSAL